MLLTDESSFTESTNDRRARVWRHQGERYADCNCVEVDRYDGGSSWSGPRCPQMAVHNCLCLLEVVKRQEGIVVIFWSLLFGHMQALFVMHSL